MQSATAAVKKTDSYYHAKFLRIKRRQGSKRAFVAVAASTLTAADHISAKRGGDPPGVCRTPASASRSSPHA